MYMYIYRVRYGVLYVYRWKADKSSVSCVHTGGSHGDDVILTAGRSIKLWDTNNYSLIKVSDNNYVSLILFPLSFLSVSLVMLITSFLFSLSHPLISSLLPRMIELLVYGEFIILILQQRTKLICIDYVIIFVNNYFRPPKIIFTNKYY